MLNKDESIDLFDNLETLPENMQAIIEKFGSQLEEGDNVIAEFLSAQEDRKQLQVRFRKHQKKAHDNAHSGAFDLFAAYMTLGTITLAMLIAIIQ